MVDDEGKIQEACVAVLDKTDSMLWAGEFKEIGDLLSTVDTEATERTVLLTYVSSTQCEKDRIPGWMDFAIRVRARFAAERGEDVAKRIFDKRGIPTHA